MRENSKLSEGIRVVKGKPKSFSVVENVLFPYDFELLSILCNEISF